MVEAIWGRAPRPSPAAKGLDIWKVTCDLLEEAPKKNPSTLSLL